LAQGNGQRFLEDQPFADLPLEIVGALPAAMLERIEYRRQHALVVRIPERDAFELSDRLALQRPRNCKTRSPLRARGHGLQLPHPTPYNLIDYFGRRPHRTLTGMAQHRAGRAPRGYICRLLSSGRGSCSFQQVNGGALRPLLQRMEQRMRKCLAATLTLGGLFGVFTLDAAQACWWDCTYRQRPARVYGYGPVYRYAPSAVVMPQLRRLGPTSSINGGFEYGGVRMASSWWRDPRRRR
jgi:hypothetical protein